MWSFGLSFLNIELIHLKPPNLVGFTIMKKWYKRRYLGSSTNNCNYCCRKCWSSNGTWFSFSFIFAKKFPLRRILLMFVLTPMMLSNVAVAIYFKLFYEPEFGLLSQFVQSFTGEMYVLLATPAGALIGVIVADAWQWTPFVMLLVLAGLGKCT